MNKVFFGAILGAAAAVAFIKLNEQGAFDGVYDEANRFMDKTKRRAREAWEYTREEAEFLAGKARAKAEQFESIARAKAGELADKIEDAGEKTATKIREKARA